MSANSTKPYLVRSIYDWCIDNGFTPFISVKAYPGLDMPIEYIKNDEIIFNISAGAVHNIMIGNEIICFMARFNGVSRKLEIPMSAIKGIFAKEVNQGIAFTLDEGNENKKILNNEESNITTDSLTYQSKNASKPNLRVIK
ncbi:ClpXP protease specificity-enhancing factor [Nitrosomonas sp.]|uniref:ClpXP protease specificity-enhancing factor n=1 Tax=Nitrosomonas sp. TaxID=42353 RepID=UPI00260DE1B7|nr:ClpXP protease specificity-enhancing factor [Nitrosomonas sp.]